MASVVSVSVKAIRPRYRDFAEWVADPNNVYIGRNCHYVNAPQSIWHNPYPVSKCANIQECLDRYEHYLRLNATLMSQITTLKGKTLGCWCKPGPCHGDVIVKVLNEVLAIEASATANKPT